MPQFPRIPIIQANRYSGPHQTDPETVAREGGHVEIHAFNPGTDWRDTLEDARSWCHHVRVRSDFWGTVTRLYVKARIDVGEIKLGATFPEGFTPAWFMRDSNAEFWGLMERWVARGRYALRTPGWFDTDRAKAIGGLDGALRLWWQIGGNEKPTLGFNKVYLDLRNRHLLDWFASDLAEMARAVQADGVIVGCKQDFHRGIEPHFEPHDARLGKGGTKGPIQPPPWGRDVVEAAYNRVAGRLEKAGITSRFNFAGHDYDWIDNYKFLRRILGEVDLLREWPGA